MTRLVALLGADWQKLLGVPCRLYFNKGFLPKFIRTMNFVGDHCIQDYCIPSYWIPSCIPDYWIHLPLYPINEVSFSYFIRVVCFFGCANKVKLTTSRQIKWKFPASKWTKFYIRMQNLFYWLTRMKFYNCCTVWWLIFLKCSIILWSLFVVY